MSHAASSTARAAFSLMEVLVAIALLAVLVGTMFVFSMNVASSRQRIMELSARQRAATLLIDGLEADLPACLVGDGVCGSGVLGDENSLSLLTRSTGVALLDRGEDQSLALGDLLRVEYRFDGSLNQAQARRAPPNPASGEAARSPWSALPGTISKLRFRYHDGARWRDSFNSRQEGRLPRAIEVAIWFDPWPADLLDDKPAGADEPPARLTFDASDTFDERAFAAVSDLALRDEPRPDRVRVIVIPDAD